MSWWLKVHHNFKPPTPQMELATMKINKTNKDFQPKVVIENPLLKIWNQRKFFNDQLGSGDLQKDWKILLPLLNLQIL
jgi:hypothetical protein